VETEKGEQSQEIPATFYFINYRVRPFS